MDIYRPWQKHLQSIKKIGIKLQKELRPQATYFIVSADWWTHFNSPLWLTSGENNVCSGKGPLQLIQINENAAG